MGIWKFERHVKGESIILHKQVDHSSMWREYERRLIVYQDQFRGRRKYENSWLPKLVSVSKIQNSKKSCKSQIVSSF